MAKWNFEKQAKLTRLETEYYEFLEKDFPKIKAVLEGAFQDKLTDKTIQNILRNATKLRAILKDWDHSISS